MVVSDCLGRSAAYLGGALIALLVSGLAQPHDISRRPLRNLKMDQALLRIHNELLIDNLSIYWVSDYCYKCLEQELISVQMNRTSKETHFVAIDTQHALTLKVNDSKEGKELCRIHYHFGEYGNYSLRIRHLQSYIMNVTCDIIISQSPLNGYLHGLVLTDLFSHIVPCITSFRTIQSELKKLLG